MSFLHLALFTNRDCCTLNIQLEIHLIVHLVPTYDCCLPDRVLLCTQSTSFRSIENQLSALVINYFKRFSIWICIANGTLSPQSTSIICAQDVNIIIQYGTEGVVEILANCFQIWDYSSYNNSKQCLMFKKLFNARWLEQQLDHVHSN